MSTSSSALWQLIRQLNKQEKQFFKKRCNELNASTPLYEKLYDAIVQQGEYNERDLLTTLSPAINKRNLAYQKHYLQQQLNEALILYNNRNNVEQEIYKSIQLIRINRKKGLMNEALSLWEKTMQKARKNEMFAMSQLLKKEFEKMILFSSVQIRYDNLHAHFRSNILTYDEYAEMITLRDLYTEVIMLKRKAHFDFDERFSNEIDALLSRVRERRAGFQSRSFWYRHYTRMCYATLYYLQGEKEMAWELLLASIADWHHEKKYLISDTEHYIEVLYMVNYVGVGCGAFDEVEDAFNHPVNSLIVDDVQVAHFEALKYLALNKVFNKTARYQDVAKLVEHMKVKYAKWELLLNAELNRTLCFSLGISCFVLDKFTESLQFIRRGATYFRDGTRKEQFIFSNLFLLLVLYRINNSKLFDAQYKSTYAFFYRKAKPTAKKGQRSFEKILMHCLHEAFYMNTYREKAEIFRKAIEELESNRESEVQQQTLAIFNFHGWLSSQIERISYKDYVQRKYRNEHLVKSDAPAL